MDDSSLWTTHRQAQRLFRQPADHAQDAVGALLQLGIDLGRRAADRRRTR